MTDNDTHDVEQRVRAAFQASETFMPAHNDQLDHAYGGAPSRLPTSGRACWSLAAAVAVAVTALVAIATAWPFTTHDGGRPVASHPSSTRTGTPTTRTGTPTTRTGTPRATPTPGFSVKSDALAQAIGELGRNQFADVYSGLTVSGNTQLILYVTDIARGRVLVKHASRSVHNAGIITTHLVLAPFTRLTLVTNTEKVFNAPVVRHLRINAVAPQNNGTGIIVWTLQPHPTPASLSKVKAVMQPLVAVPVTVEVGHKTYPW